MSNSTKNKRKLINRVDPQKGHYKLKDLKMMTPTINLFLCTLLAVTGVHSYAISKTHNLGNLRSHTYRLDVDLKLKVSTSFNAKIYPCYTVTSLGGHLPKSSETCWHVPSRRFAQFAILCGQSPYLNGGILAKQLNVAIIVITFLFSSFIFQLKVRFC